MKRHCPVRHSCIVVVISRRVRRSSAAREKACCAFYDFRISATGGEVCWEIGLVDGAADGDEDMTRTMLDVFYDAPDNVAGSMAAMKQLLAEGGIAVTTSESGTVMQLERHRDDAAAKGPVAREQIFDGLLARLDEQAS